MRKRYPRDELRSAMQETEFRDTAAFLDEIPAAYKPIDVVTGDAKDLVAVVYTLHQIVNVKCD